MNDIKPPIFILGMNGSGTTMLADALGRHPELYILRYESKILPHIITHGQRYGDPNTLSGRMKIAHTITRSAGFWRSNGSRDFRIPDKELSISGVPAVIQAVYLHLARLAGKQSWGDKSPVNTLHVSMLATAFPEARFLHIIRDPRDAAQSFHRRWGFDPLHTTYRWKFAVTSARRQGMNIGKKHYMEIFYENLTTDPETEMRKVCAFLGLQYHPTILQTDMRHANPGLLEAGQLRIMTNSGKWRTYFSVETIKHMEDIAGKLMSELGYPVSVEGDRDAMPVMMRFWQIKDGICLIRSGLKRWGLSGLPGLIRHLIAARRQRIIRE